MLSKSKYSWGQWHKLVPRERIANLKFRRSVLKQCLTRKDLQAAMMYACKHDILFWINTFVWQFNPNSIGLASEEIGPFVTWDFQDAAIFGTEPWVGDDGEEHLGEPGILQAIERRYDLLIEKSREMGASWLCLIVFVWLYLFWNNQKFLAISRNQDAVDKLDDPDSLFWKVRFIFDYLPGWMTKDRYEPGKLKFSNKKCRSYITGQASTGKAGVGGRATAMFVDEFSQVDEDYEVLNRTSDTTKCRIFNGTHKGSGTAFYELSQRSDMKKLQMHWTQHPDKRKGLYRYNEPTGQIEVIDKGYVFPADYRFVMQFAPTGGPFPGIRSPWYDEQCSRKSSPRAVAMDLDIDPEGSVSQFFLSQTMHHIEVESVMEPVWIGDVLVDLELAVSTGLYARDKGPLRLWIPPRLDGTFPCGNFVIAGDISAGTGATNSVLFIGNADIGEQVGEYATPHLNPEKLAPIAVALAKLFPNANGEPAMIGWEIPGPGVNFGKTIQEFGMTNLLYRQVFTANKVAEKLTAPGWVASRQSKLELLIDLRGALDNREFVVRSSMFFKEAQKYRYDESGFVVHPSDEGADDPTAARVNHGDRVIAAGIARRMMSGRSVQPTEQKHEIPIGSLAYRRELRKNKAPSTIFG